MLLWRQESYLKPLKHAIRQCTAVMHFELPVGALVVYDPSFEIFDRVNACTLEDLFTFGSDSLDGGERRELEQFEMFAYPL